MLSLLSIVLASVDTAQSTLVSYLPFLGNEYVLAAILGIFVALPLIVFLVNSDWQSNLPPRFSVLAPALRGEFNMKLNGPMLAIRKGYEKHGEIFRIKLAHQGLTVLVGNEANHAMFDASDRELTQKEVYRFTVPVFGKKIVYDAHPSVMVQQLKFVRTGLTGVAMRAHCKKILTETSSFFEKLPEQGEVDLLEELSELIVLTASRCLLGDEVREKMHKEVADLYSMLEQGMTHLTVFWPNAPTKAHANRDLARKKMGEIFSTVIQARRKAQAQGAEKPSDFLQVMIDARYRDGRTLEDDEIAGLLVAALFGGQHTSSITSTWMGFMMLQPETKKTLIPRLLQEQKEVLSKHNGELSFEALGEMELLHACLKETLRLFPPLVLLMRKVKKNQKYKNFVIPKGDIAVTCPPVTHRLETVYKDPLKFDPDRYARGEGTGKYDYIAFGGGRHACLGNNFAHLQIKTIWSHLLRNFDFDLVSPGDPVIDYNTSVVAGSANNLRVRFKRRHDFKL